MFSLYKLILKTNIKSPVIMFPILMPLIFLLMFAGSIDANAVNTSVLAVLSITVMQSGLMGFGFNFMGLKKSILLKRIGATKITKFEAMMGIALYALTLFVISTTWTFILAEIFTVTNFFPGEGFIWGDVAWGSLAFGVVIGLFLSYALGMMFLSFSKDDQQYSMLVMFYFFLASFLGGMLIPNGSANIEWMRYVGYAIPNVYSSHLMSAAGYGVDFVNIFNFSAGYTYNGLAVEGWEAALNVFVPIVIGIVAILTSIKFFKWD